VGKPAATVPRCDAVTRTARDAPKRVRIPRRATPNDLLLQCPRRFDWVEIGRVRRQVHDTNSVCPSSWNYATIVMGTEVVHDEDVAVVKPGEKSLREPLDESICVGGLVLRAQHNPARMPNRAEQREARTPLDQRYVIRQLAAALDPTVATTHRKIHPGFVEEDKAVYRDTADLLLECFAFPEDVRPETLQ
jgi:hypothetical protein